MSNTRKASNPAAAILDEYTIEYAGETYTITREDMDDLDLILAFQQGNVIGAVMNLLGDDDWQRFTDSVKTKAGKVPVTKSIEFVELIAGKNSPLGNFVSSLGS